MRWWTALTLAACGPRDPDPSDELAYDPTWDGVQALIDDRCIGCHVTYSEASNLPFPAAIAHDLVSGAEELVVPGDPAASRLWRVLSGELGPDDFAIMPLWSGPLPASEVGHVEAWIADGAPHPFAGADLDGDGVAIDAGDCDEARPEVHPGATEVCGDGLDNDCSGDADGPDAANAKDWYVDADGDGHGLQGSGPVRACDPPAGWSELADDCLDTDDAVHGGATEVVDGDDDDCDGFTDELTSHARDVRPLYAYNCGCHTSGLEPILLLDDQDYERLVGVPSTQLPTMNLVEPGDPSASYLWHKLNGTQASVGGTGDAMPRLAPPLQPAELASIEAWILEGAPP